MQKFLEKMLKKHPSLKESIDSVIEHTSNWEDLRNNLIEEKHCDDAIELSIIKFEQSSQAAISYTNLAETYYLCGNIQSAINIFEKAINEKSNKLIGRLYVKYAKICEEYYDENKVIEIYSSYLKNKNFLVLHRNFIRYLYSIKKYEKTVTECLSSLEKHDDKLLEINFVLSRSYEKLGDLLNAKEILTKLIEKNINNGEAWRNLALIEEKINQSEDDEYSNIVRQIDFSQEHHAAGISILQNFGKLLRDKYSDTPAKVIITQNGLVVKMVVIPPDGKKLEVEEYLNNYGLVITGKMEPEKFASTPLQLLELKTELKLAYTRIEMQQEQMKFLDSQYSTRVISLEEQVNWLRNQVGTSLTFQQDSLTELIQVISTSNNKNSKIVKKLLNSITNRNFQEMKDTVNILKSEEPDNYKRLKDFISNTVSSAGANAPSWIEFLSRVFPA